MDKKIIIFIVSLIVLAASIEWISHLFQKDSFLQTPPVSEENLVITPPSEQGKDNLPVVEGETTSTPENLFAKQLTLLEIESEIKKIQKKIDILSLQVELVVLKERLKQAQLTLIKVQMLDIQNQVTSLSKQVASFTTGNMSFQIVAGASQEIMLSEDPILP